MCKVPRHSLISPKENDKKNRKIDKQIDEQFKKIAADIFARRFVVYSVLFGFSITRQRFLFFFLFFYVYGCSTAVLVFHSLSESLKL